MASSMAMSTVLFFFFSVIVRLSSAAVHTVGDDQGWTIINLPNYTAWAASQTFSVGDILVFTYNIQLHNVVEVKKSDYDACTLKSPIATYATGNDSIPITTAGTRYYLCGIPGHCLGGQKVEISVQAVKSVEHASSPGPSPSASVSASRAPQGEMTTPVNSDTGGGIAASVPAPGPKAGGAPVGHRGLGLVAVNVVLVAAYALLG